MDAASDELLPSIRDDSVVMLCAKDELNVVLVVLVWVIEDASDELFVLTLADSVVILCARRRAKRYAGRVSSGDGRSQ
jgi:hypothetical protein